MFVFDLLIHRGYWDTAGDGDGGGGGGDGGDAGAGDGDQGDSGSGDDLSIAGGDDDPSDPVGEGGSIAGDGDAGDGTSSGDGGEGSADSDAGEGGDSGDGSGDGESSGAPEGGYSEFTVPEGGAPLDETALAEFRAIASEADLSQAQAQALVDQAYGLVSRTQQSVLDSMEHDFQSRQASWVKELREDSELGGANFAATVATVRRGAAFFAGGQGTEGHNALRAWLKDSGMGNHPMIVRGLHRIGELVSDDGIVEGSTSSSAAATDGALRLYPDEAGDA